MPNRPAHADRLACVEAAFRSLPERYAFLTTARNIYLEQPFGREGFYPRIATLEPPALFVWTSGDRLVPAAFLRRVRQWLPSAEQIVLESCGHAPQVERPEQANGLVTRFLAQHSAPRPAARRRVASAA